MYFVVAGMKNVFCLLSHYYGLYPYISLWHYKFYFTYVWKLNYSTFTFILIRYNYLAFSNYYILFFLYKKI